VWPVLGRNRHGGQTLVVEFLRESCLHQQEVKKKRSTMAPFGHQSAGEGDNCGKEGGEYNVNDRVEGERVTTGLITW
jgi:hypothetical protein